MQFRLWIKTVLAMWGGWENALKIDFVKQFLVYQPGTMSRLFSATYTVKMLKHRRCISLVALYADFLEDLE